MWPEAFTSGGRAPWQSAHPTAARGEDRWASCAATTASVASEAGETLVKNSVAPGAAWQRPQAEAAAPVTTGRG
jgi:hypothetical protein